MGLLFFYAFIPVIFQLKAVFQSKNDPFSHFLAYLPHFLA